MGSKVQTSYYKSFDSLRFLAILSVILYHYIPFFVSGGFLGVNIFLVLSGFLLGKAMDSSYLKGFNYKEYIRKKFIRLTVPLVGMLVISIAFFTVFDFKFLFNVKHTVWSSLLYVNNYLQIFSGSSYFEAFINPSPFIHLWYLGVQFQLFIITPFIFLFSKKVLKSNSKVSGLFFILAIISALLMGVLYPIDGDPSRVYYGVDTRAFSFFIGIATSIMRENRLLADITKRRFIFIVSLLVMIAMIFIMRDTSTLTYRGGMFIFDILVAIVIKILTLDSKYNNIVGLNFLSVPGKISYSVYLWYYPVFCYFTYGALSSSWIGGKWYLQVIGLFILSLVFHLIFEREFTERVLKKGFKIRLNLREKDKKKLIKNIIILVVVLISLIGVLVSPTGKNETVAQLEARLAEEKRKVLEAKQKEALSMGKDIPDIEGLSREEMLYAREQKITFVGDSILLSGSSALAEIFPNSHIDGVVGRQLYKSVGVIKQLKDRGELEDTVVVILGTNGNFTEGQLDNFVNEIGDERKIIFLTTFTSSSWQDEVNESIKEYAKEKDNVYVFDWYSEIKGKPEWLEEDKVHLNRAGAHGLGCFIAKKYYEEFDDIHKGIKEAKEKEEKVNDRYKD